MPPISYFLPDLIFFDTYLTSTHNSPPAESDKGERGVCWGHPRPRQEASPPAPLIRETSNIALTGHINGLLRFLQELWVPLPASSTFRYFFCLSFLVLYYCLINGSLHILI